MLRSMQKKYGAKKGKDVYFAMENKNKKKGILRSMLAKAKSHHDLMAKA